MVDLSIIVGTLNRKQQFLSMLNSVIRHTTVPWEMIVSDAGDIRLELQDVPRNIKIIEENPRLGHIAGYNKAFELAEGRWVIWLNDDVEVQEGWAFEAVRMMERNKWIGIGALYWANQGMSGYRVDWYQGMPYANFGIISREFGNTIGWFDEILYFYGGDNSIAFRSFLAGRPVIPIPSARVLHKPFADRIRTQNESHQPHDAAKLMAKYGPFLKDMQKVHERFKCHEIL